MSPPITFTSDPLSLADDLAVEPGAGLHRHSRAEDAVRDGRGVLDGAAVEQDRALDHGAFADPRAGTDHAGLPQLRAIGDLASVPHHHRLVELIAHHGLDALLEDVPVGFQKAIRRPDVDPVALQPDPVEPLADQAWEDLSLDRDLLGRRDLFEHRALEQIAARVDLVG